MMIMRWCTVQTNKCDLQAKTYSNICIHHKQHNNNENKFPVLPDLMCNKWQNMINKHLRHPTTENYDNNGKGGYFRFDDDNKMNYKYIISIT